MNKKKIISVLVAVSMTMMITSYSVSAAQGMMGMGPNNNSFTHGCSTTITEDMLTTTDSIPSDYDVNESTQGKAKDGDYLSLFDTETVQDVHINLSENNWNYLLQNASEKPNVLTDSVTIGNETVKYASIKTKGNLTLRSVWSSDSDRFSFTVNFGKYIKKKNGYSANQNFHGLSKISFNNIYGDSTLMKEYLSYNLMTELGVPTPAYSLVNLYINGELWGVYMMVESIDSSLTKRTLDEDNSFLTKPESSGGDLVYNESLDKYYDETTQSFNFGDDLQYPTSSSDPLYAYNGLWENDEDTFNDVKDSLPTVFKWLKTLNELNNCEDPNTEEYKSSLESIMNVDSIIRYFAVNTYLVNLDSYQSGQMQNYALTINDDGYANVLPWDYNYSFGNFRTNAESMINFDISNPVLNVSLSDRPLLNVLLQNDEYYAKYTKYLNDCCIVASEGGITSDGNTYSANNYSTIIDNFEKTLSVDYAKDPTAFYTVDQYEIAIDTLKQIIKLRSTAVVNQINGNTEKITTDLNLNTMGDSTGGGGNMPGGDRPSSTLTDDASKITVSGMFPSEATLNVTNLTSGNDYTKAISSVGQTDDVNLSVYNISLDMSNFNNNPPNNNNQFPPTENQGTTNNNNNQTPPTENPDNNNNNNQAPPDKPDNNNFGPGNNFNEQYSISFAVSATDANDVDVYQINEDGTNTKLTGTLEDGKYTATSSSLGLFVLSTKNNNSQSSSTTSGGDNSGNTNNNSSQTEGSNEDNNKDNSNTVSTKDTSMPIKASVGLLASIGALIINRNKKKNN